MADPVARSERRELERKFLVRDPPDWLSRCLAEEIEQGYVAMEGDDVEVRLRRRGETSYLTVKRGTGQERTEVEVELDRRQFEALWPLTRGRRVAKRRHHVPTDAGEITVDVYSGELAGLITAEIEFGPGQDPAGFTPPEWLDEELTGHAGYANKNLATRGIPTDPPSASRNR